jgi:hypothetical protein
VFLEEWGEWEWSPLPLSLHPKLPTPTPSNKTKKPHCLSSLQSNRWLARSMKILFSQISLAKLYIHTHKTQTPQHPNRSRDKTGDKTQQQHLQHN